MLFLHALPCEQAHRQSLQQYHQSLQDITSPKETPRKKLSEINVLIIVIPVVFLFSWFFLVVLQSRRLFLGIGQGPRSLLLRDLNDSLERMLVGHVAQTRVLKVFVENRSTGIYKCADLCTSLGVSVG